MKVAIVYPPHHHRRFSENLKVIDEEFVLAPPIILAYVAAVLERAGHEVLLLDAAALGLSREDVSGRLRRFAPDLLAFRLDTYNFQETLGWIKYLRFTTGVPVLVGGINLSLYPEETMAYEAIDYGIIGEALDTLPLFLRSLKDAGPLRDIPGLCWKDAAGAVRINPPAGCLTDFDDYPYPARHLLPNGKYRSFVSQRRNYTVMLTSTGCPYKCSFCAIAGLNHYRERSWESVIGEIEECYHKYGIREIDFFDATFFINKPRCRRLFAEIRRRGLDITWTCRTRVDVVDEDILRAAAAAGCRMIFWGIESSSQEVLDGVNKGIRREQTAAAIRMAQGLGIRNLGFLMIGNPGETAETVRETMRFVKSIGLDYVQICRTIAKPGSALHRRLARETGYDYWKEFIAGKVGEERLPAPWVGMEQRQVEDLLKRAYYGFYFRPSFILRTLLRTRSLDELLRYIRVGIRMIFHYFHTDVAATKDSVIVNRVAHWKLRPDAKPAAADVPKIGGLRPARRLNREA
ncbi:MAG: radical SAM protein [Elusimicrobiota bacterium]